MGRRFEPCRAHIAAAAIIPSDQAETNVPSWIELQKRPVLETTPGIETTRELAVQIADIIAETPASDTRVIDIHDLSPIADFFVVCSGENERQLRAINRAIDDELAKTGKQARRTEGDATSGWILMDYSDVVVHIFDADLRAFYRLEELWSEAPVLLSIL